MMTELKEALNKRIEIKMNFCFKYNESFSDNRINIVSKGHTQKNYPEECKGCKEKIRCALQ